MAKLVFDIETSALSLEQFDEAQQEYLFRECEKIADAAARDTRHAEIQQQFNLWPFTAQVVCIAMQTTCAVKGQRLNCCWISAWRVSRAAASAIFSHSRNRYSCCASSNCSSDSAEVSMSNTSLAITRRIYRTSWRWPASGG